MKGVILHGGAGTRLRPLTFSDVKQLLPIAGKPISQYGLEDMVNAGIRDINIVVGSVGAREVEELYGDGSRFGANVTYTYQPKPEGIAQAIGLTEKFVGNESFVVYLGDNLLNGGISNLKETFIANDYDALIAVTRVNNPQNFGVMVMKDGRPLRLEEKPEKPVGNLAMIGIYFMKPGIFDIIRALEPSPRGEYEITDALQILLEKNAKVGVQEIQGWWKDTGTMEDLIDANRLVLDEVSGEIRSKPPVASNVVGRVRIMEDVSIDDRTRIMGPCYIGSGTKLKNAYIGPYTSIGSNCSVEGVEIEESIVMDGCELNGGGEIRIFQSLLGTGCVVLKGNGTRRATRLLVGRSSHIEM